MAATLEMFNIHTNFDFGKDSGKQIGQGLISHLAPTGNHKLVAMSECYLSNFEGCAHLTCVAFHLDTDR